MQLSSETTHRLTAVLCTLVAVAILAAGVTAQHEPAVGHGSRLTQLESDLRFQVQSAFRMRPREADKRLEHIDVVLREFRSQARTASDQQLLADWLIEATRRSMPGLIAPLPQVPEFSIPELPIAASKPVVVEKPEPPVAIQAEQPEETVAPKPAPVPLSVTIPEPTKDVTVAEVKPAIVVQTPAEPSKNTQFVNNAKEPVAAEPPSDSVVLNLNELAARIAGYHLALDELDAELYENREPGEAEIEQFIQQLASVQEDYHFVKLYYESLNATERRRVNEPRGMQRVIEGVRRRIEKLRRAIETDFLGEFDRTDVDRVEQLHTKLNVIAERIAW